MYTIVSTHYRGSGRIEGGGQEFEEGIEADDIFYENFAKNFYPTHARKLLFSICYGVKHPLHSAFEPNRKGSNPRLV